MNGALSKAEEALNSARGADESLVKQDRLAEQVLLDMTKAQQKASAAQAAAQRAYDSAAEAKDRSMGEVDKVDEVVKAIEEFTVSDKATPEDVRKEIAEVSDDSVALPSCCTCSLVPM